MKFINMYMEQISLKELLILKVDDLVNIVLIDYDYINKFEKKLLSSIVKECFVK